ncbi:MAG TPA: hypothetical protein VME46_22370 [Acidimicrobiales bacterium]|nr:hypothetical protein [Acidimicrobiales bacterium]
MQNQVVSVHLLSGWSKDSSSTSTDLILDGPSSVGLGLETQEIASSYTLSDVFSTITSNYQSNSSFSNVQVCQQPTKSALPGNPSLPGGYVQICFTAQTQSGSVSIVAILFEALVPITGDSSHQVLASEDCFIPQSLGSNAFTNIAQPELNTLSWLGMSASS